MRLGRPFHLLALSLITAAVALPRASRAEEAAPVAQWTDVLTTPALSIEGLPWLPSLGSFRRLPLDPQGTEFSKDVNELAGNTAGAQIRFRTNSAFVRVRVENTFKSFMYHMPSSGQSGVDLYDETTGRLRFCGTARPDPETASYESALCAWGNGEWKDVTLNLPLYNGLDKLELGLSEGAQLAAPRAHRNAGRIVIYGTSITQGAAASRPGLAWTNQLSRAVDQEVVNLGFSGAGLGEPALARRITEIDNVSLILLDYEANAGELTRTTLGPFISILRAAHPNVPLVVVSQIPWVWQIRSPGYANWKAGLREFQRKTVSDLHAAGDANIYFIDGNSLMPLDHFEDGLVDGVHPNDLGMSWITSGLTSQLSALGLVHTN